VQRGWAEAENTLRKILYKLKLPEKSYFYWASFIFFINPLKT